MAFREIFLLHVPAAGAATFRQFGRYMFDTLAEGGPREALEPRVGARVRALAEDLRFSAQALARLGGARAEGGRPPEEAALAKKAESWAREVLDLVRAMEAASAGAGEVR